MAIQTDKTLLRKGQMVRWDASKGFGFIRPADGGKDVFVHISALPQGYLPKIGNHIVFSATDDPQGRGQRALKAVVDDPTTDHPARPASVNRSWPNARPPSGSAPSRASAINAGAVSRPMASKSRSREQTTLKPLSFNAKTVLVGLLAIACLAGAVTMVPITPIPLIAYPIVSLAAYFVYARDKLSAIRGAWRVPESTLHLLEAAGGWPGAYIAQQTMRHKTVKTSYQIVYWLIVCTHLGFWGLWIVSPEIVLSQIPGIAQIQWTP